MVEHLLNCKPLCTRWERKSHLLHLILGHGSVLGGVTLILQVRELRLLEVLRLAQGHMVKRDYLNHALPAKLTHPHPMAASLCVGQGVRLQG